MDNKAEVGLEERVEEEKDSGLTDLMDSLYVIEAWEKAWDCSITDKVKKMEVDNVKRDKDSQKGSCKTIKGFEV
ncbi:unnamed protein product [Caretta caretta]